MAHRDFVVPERQPGDEITFGVNGRKFKALPTPPIDVVLRMGRPNSVLADLVEGMLVTEDEAAWRDLLRDKSLEVRGPDGFGKVVEDLFWWLVDEQAAVTGEPIVVRPPQPAQEAASPNDFEVFKQAVDSGSVVLPGQADAAAEPQADAEPQAEPEVTAPADPEG